MEKIANKIQAELKRAGKKQKDLAKFMGMHPAALSRLLSEETFNRESMIKISQFLGLDINFFNTESSLKSNHSSSKESTKNDNSEVDYLKEIIKVKDDLLKAKEELIATLKEKNKKT